MIEWNLKDTLLLQFLLVSTQIKDKQGVTKATTATELIA